MNESQLANLPSPFYRVAVKCLIFNDEQAVLVVRADEGDIEIPGGGWEHGETIEECVQRELSEELGVRAKSVSDVRAILQGKSEKGWGVLRVVVTVELESTDFVFNDPEVIDAFFVSQERFSGLNFCPSDSSFAESVGLIWPTR